MLLVNDDSVVDPKSGRYREAGVRGDAHGNEDEVCGDQAPVGFHGGDVSRIADDGGHGRTRAEVDSVAAMQGGEVPPQLISQYVPQWDLSAFQHGHLAAGQPCCSRGLQADPARADDHPTLARSQRTAEGVGVLDPPAGVDAGKICSWQAEGWGGRAGGNDEVVIGHGIARLQPYFGPSAVDV